MPDSGTPVNSFTEGDTPPPKSEADAGEKEEDLTGKLPAPVARRRTILLIVLLSRYLLSAYLTSHINSTPNSAATLVVAYKYLIHSPPAFLRPYLSPLRRAFPFRVTEGRLVRWAAEDLALAGLEYGDDGEGEEDLMVNQEEIPLKPSPRLGRGRVADYGAAR